LASLGSTIRLRDGASKADLSASHFSHAFKATLGMTVCHYIRRSALNAGRAPQGDWAAAAAIRDPDMDRWLPLRVLILHAGATTEGQRPVGYHK